MAEAQSGEARDEQRPAAAQHNAEEAEGQRADLSQMPNSEPDWLQPPADAPPPLAGPKPDAADIAPRVPLPACAPK